MPPGRPKYHRIVHQLLAEIRRGTYAIGDRLPSEHRLMSAFGVSRYTVRQAMQSLRQMGVVEAQQGRGTLVLSRPESAVFIEKIPSLEAAIGTGGGLDRRLVRQFRVAADAALSDAFGCEPGREFLEMHFLRRQVRAPRWPAVFLRVWIDPLFASVPERLETVEGSTRDAIVEVMQRHFEFETGAIRQTVSACAMDAACAELLHRREGDSGLKIERRYYSLSVSLPYLRTLSICRSDLMQIESHFLASRNPTPDPPG